MNIIRTAWTGRRTGDYRDRASCPTLRIPILILLAILMMMPGVPQAVAAQTSSSIQKELDAVAAAYGKLESQIAQTESKRKRLHDEQNKAEAVMAQKAAAFQKRASYMYKEGAAGSFFGELLTAPNLGVFMRRIQYLAVLGDSDARVVEDLTLAQKKSAEISASLSATVANQQALASNLNAKRQELERKYSEVKRAEEAKRREAEARLAEIKAAEAARRQSSRASTTSPAVAGAAQLKQLEAIVKGEPAKKVVSAGRFAQFSLPISGSVGFADTWGAPRSGGRRHQGTDVMAPCGAPVVAVTDGVISRLMSGGSGGIMAYLKAPNGDQFFYAHLQGYAAGLSQGKRVAAGDLIGSNGRTGNASGGPCHVHFEWHPGGGAPVNPYPLLSSAR